jgi:hypothetical protein
MCSSNNNLKGRDVSFDQFLVLVLVLVFVLVLVLVLVGCFELSWFMSDCWKYRKGSFWTNNAREI